MRMKKWLFILAAVGVMGVFAAKVNAAPAWHECTLDKIGESGAAIYFQVTDTANLVQTWTVGPSDPTQANRALALALTAMSSGFLIQAYYDASVSYGQATAFFLITP